MFFLSYSKGSTISNMPGLVDLIAIISIDSQRNALFDLISTSNFTETKIIVNDITISKIRDFLSFNTNAWSLSVSILEILFFYDSYVALERRDFIVMFDGVKFKFIDYSDVSQNELERLYYNRDIYFDISLLDNIYAETYSTNKDDMRLLYLLYNDGTVAVIQDEILQKLQDGGHNIEFGTNSDMTIKILDHDYLSISAYYYPSMEYIIHKDSFFYLFNILNDHEHGSGKRFCSKMTIIVRDKEAYIELVD